MQYQGAFVRHAPPPPRLLGYRAAKALAGLAALLVLAGLVAGLAILSAADVWAQSVDYDSDDDNLIEVSTLAQLNAIRHDLNGDGHGDNASAEAAYRSVFPVNSIGCALGTNPADSTCTGYELTADLDFDENSDGSITSADSTYWDSGNGWEPIGEGSGPGVTATPYAGTFNGNGHIISNLFISRAGETHTGFFGATSGTIQNVGIVKANVTGTNNVGALVGQLRGGAVRNVYSTGSISGEGGIGGLFGLVGPDSGHTTTISAVWTSASISGDANIGGLIGIHRQGSSITASYATGTVTGSSNSVSRGGLVGSLRDTATVTASYSIGNILPTGGTNAGGLVGVLSHSGQASNVTYSYWDTQTSGRSTSNGGSGQTTSALQTPTDYGTGIYANWNVNVDGLADNDDPWHFGTASQYPALEVDFDGDGAISSALELGPQRPPGAPAGLTVRLEQDDMDNDILVVTWSEPISGSAPTGYQYRYDNSGDSDRMTWSQDWTDTTDKTFTIPHPLAGEYDIEVQAVNLHPDTPAGLSDSYYDVVPNNLPTGDYDRDDDGLIEITNLDQLNAIRWDLDGDGEVDDNSDPDTTGTDAFNYTAAFPHAVAGMGCPSTCTGYELFNIQPEQSFIFFSGTDRTDYYANKADLDFDAPGSYADGTINTAWTGGDGWEPINGFAATFRGNGYGVRNLFIDRGSTDNVGLFGSIGANGMVDELALKEVNVTGRDNVGGLVGQNSGHIRWTYVTGSVEGDENVGGAVGNNSDGATVRVVWTSVDVEAESNAGGVVGNNAGNVAASYSIGSVEVSTNTGNAGGLVGNNAATGTITISYSTGTVVPSSPIISPSIGGLVGRNANAFTGCEPNTDNTGCRSPATAARSYWDTESSGLSVGVGSDDTDGNGMIDGSETATAGVTGKTTAELKAPDRNSGIYADWWSFDTYGNYYVNRPWVFGSGADYPKLAANFQGTGLGSSDKQFGPQHLGPVGGLSAVWAGGTLTVSWNHYPRYSAINEDPPNCDEVVCYEKREYIAGIGMPAFSNVPVSGVDAANQRASFPTIISQEHLTGYIVDVRPAPVEGVMGRTASLAFSLPGKPTAVIAAVTNTGLVVGWTAPTDTGDLPITGYSVQYSTDGSTWQTATHTDTGTMVTIALSNPQDYNQVRVAAINPVGQGPYAAANVVTTQEFTQQQRFVTSRSTAPPQGVTQPTQQQGVVQQPVQQGGGQQKQTQNRAPIANAGSDQKMVTAGATVTLRGSGSDPDGDTLTYSWTQDSGTTVTLSSATAATPTFTAPAGPATLVFSLVVNDGKASSAADTVTITVKAASVLRNSGGGGGGERKQVQDRAPIANAGPDQKMVTAGVTVTLDGSGSRDPDGDKLTWSWIQDSGDPVVELSDPAAASPTFTAPAGPATLVFSLVVRAGGANSMVDTVTVTVPG